MSTGSIQDLAEVNVHFKEKYPLSLSFKAGTGTFVKGLPVKVDTTADYQVIPIAAATDFPIGYVEIAEDQYGRITVNTFFTAVIEGTVKTAAIARGAEITFDGTNPSSGPPNVITSATGNVVVGRSLNNGAAVGDVIEIGILQSPYIK